MENARRKASGGRVVLVEFNELTPRLMERWVADGALPNFAKFYGQSEVFTTDAGESGEALNPWVQWVTAHTGVPLSEHGVFHLNDTGRLQHDQVWDLASRAGRRVWVCGSMNAHYRAPVRGHVLPDPWASDVDPYPAGEFEPYFTFVQRNVQEHTKGAVAGSPADVARFAAFMVRNGLSPHTVRSALRQLVDERRSGRHRWRRATIMDRLQFDVFRAYYRRYKPHLSTFFLNSTAHFQHMYWRNLEPERFTIQPSAGEQAEFRDAIFYGYRAMDDLLGRIMELAGDEATLIFSTALSQQPYLKADGKGGKRYYRLRDHRMLTRLGIDDAFEYEPVMADNFFLRFENEEAAARAEVLIPSFRVDGEVAIRVEHREGSTVFLQCRLRKKLAPGAMLVGENGRELPADELLYLTEGLKSGYHHPDGMLWIRAPSRAHAVHPGKVPLLAMAPTTLDILGVAPPACMKHPSLLAESARSVA